MFDHRERLSKKSGFIVWLLRAGRWVAAFSLVSCLGCVNHGRPSLTAESCRIIAGEEQKSFIPPKPPRREWRNIQKNPSFEMGLKDWVPYRPMDASVEIVEGGAFDGKKCLRMTASKERDGDHCIDWMNYGQSYIMNAPTWMSELPVKEGDSVVMSAYLRSDTPGTQAILSLHGCALLGSAGNVFDVDNKWKRYEVSGKIVKNDLYLTFSIFQRGGGKLYIDAVQVEKGEKATPFVDNDAANISLTPEEMGRPMLFNPGERVKFTAKASGYKPAKLAFALWDDFQQKCVTDKTVAPCVGKNGEAGVTVSLVMPYGGYYELWAFDPDFPARGDHLAIGCLEKLDAETQAAHSPVTMGNTALDGDFTSYADMLKFAGFGDVRVYIVGGAVWPEKDRWEWPDKRMAAVKANGIKPLICVECLPPWAVPKGSLYETLGHLQAFPPSALEQWRTLIRETVKRYGDMTDQWECWNEPDGPNKELARVDEFVAYQKAMHEEVHRLQPNSVVMGPGVATSEGPRLGCQYIAEVLERGGAPYIDKISFHPYPEWGFMAPPEATGYEARLAHYTELAKKYGKGLVVTEIGWMADQVADVYKVKRVEQMRYASLAPRALAMLCAAGVEKIYYFSFARCSILGYNTDSMPLVNSSWYFAPTRAFVSLAAARRFVCGYSEVRKIATPDPQMYCYAFAKGGKSMAMLWQTADEQAVLVKTSSKPRAYNLYGAPMDTVDAGGGAVALPCSEYPVYLEWDGSAELSVKPIVQIECKKLAGPPKGMLGGTIRNLSDSPVEHVVTELPLGWTGKVEPGIGGHVFSVNIPENAEVGMHAMSIILRWKGADLRFTKPISVYSRDWEPLLKGGKQYTLGSFDKDADGWAVEEQIIPPQGKKPETESSIAFSPGDNGGVLRCRLKCGANDHYAFWAGWHSKGVESDFVPFSFLEFDGKADTVYKDKVLSVVLGWASGYTAVTLDNFFSDNQWHHWRVELNKYPDLKRYRIEKILIGVCGQDDVDFSIDNIKLTQ